MLKIQFLIFYYIYYFSPSLVTPPNPLILNFQLHLPISLSTLMWSALNFWHLLRVTQRERWRNNRWVTGEGWKGAVWMLKCDLNQKQAVWASLWGSLSLQFCQQTALSVQSGSRFHFFKRRRWYYTGQGDKGSLSFSQERPSVRPCACLCVCGSEG